MAERQIIFRCVDGKWSAAYSDQPEVLVYGATMQDAIDRLQLRRPREEPTEQSSPSLPDEDADRLD
jgi:hypothetical protein